MVDAPDHDPIAAPRYAGVATLLRTPLARDPSELDIALVGVPFDGGAENRPGQRHGPREVRNMSSLMRAVHHVTRVNPYELCRVADMGDVPMSIGFDLEASHAAITEFFRSVHAAGAVPLSVGGDHSITLPILRAIATDRPVGLVHIVQVHPWHTIPTGRRRRAARSQTDSANRHSWCPELGGRVGFLS
jgi:guanidinopropionase